MYDIREAYKNHKRRKEIYELYKDKITFNSFANIWSGISWKNIHSDVYTEENKQYYSKEATNGESSENALFSNDEVIAIRTRYVSESAKSIYQDYKDRCSYQTLQGILWGRNYKNLPLYKKKERKWINI